MCIFNQFIDKQVNKEKDYAGDENENIFEGTTLSKSINLNYVFFPGLIAHEFAHYIGCVLAGAKVVEVVWWSKEGGHVLHYRPKPINGAIISLAPFIFNNVIAIISYAQAISSFNSGSILYAALFLWLGFSFAVYSIPSIIDMKVSFMHLELAQNDLKKLNVISRIFWLIVYSIWYIIQYVIVYLIYPLAKYRDLRIGWAILVAVFMTTSYASVLLH